MKFLTKAVSRVYLLQLIRYIWSRVTSFSPGKVCFKLQNSLQNSLELANYLIQNCFCRFLHFFIFDTRSRNPQSEIQWCETSIWTAVKNNFRPFLGIKTMLKGYKLFIINCYTEIDEEIWNFDKYIVLYTNNEKD